MDTHIWRKFKIWLNVAMEEIIVMEMIFAGGNSLLPSRVKVCTSRLDLIRLFKIHGFARNLI